MIRSATLLGVVFLGLVSAFSAVADGLTKHLTGAIPPAQLYFFCGLIVMISSLGMRRMGLGPSGQLRTATPWLMGLRTVIVSISIVCYYYAFKWLSLAEVFAFVGMMPLLAALLAKPLLGEKVAPAAWGALALGVLGILFLFPHGLRGAGLGHFMAMAAVFLGTISLMLMRKMGRVEGNALAQVFWPHFGLFVVMGAALPFVWVPMGTADMLLVACYGVAILGARWLMVPCLQRLPTHVATMLLNLQFVWMVGLDWMAFDGLPVFGVVAGAAFILTSGVALVFEQSRQAAGGQGFGFFRKPVSALTPAE